MFDSWTARLSDGLPTRPHSLGGPLQALSARFAPMSPFWPAVIVVGLAGLTRLPWLTWHSVDFDEAMSLHWTRVPLLTLVPKLLTVRDDSHPPGYYALLKPWVALLGDSEIGLRLFSVATGVIFVALAYRLGKELFSARVGLAAALLAALNPALVYESLDARMYMPAGAFVLAGSLALWRAVRWGGWFRFVAAFVWLTLACYSNIAAAFAMAGMGVGLVFFGIKRLWKGALTLGVVGVAYLPYAINAWRASGVRGSVTFRRAPGLWELLDFTAQWSLFHDAPLARWLAVGIGMVVWGAVLWGLVGRSGSLRARGWVAGGLMVPLLVLVILSQREPLLQPKLLVVTTLAPLLLAVNLPGRAWLTALVLAGEMWGYSALWRPAAQRENWRAAGEYLTAHVGPHDVTVAHLHYYEEPLRYYYPGRIVTPFGSHLTRYDEVAAGLAPYLDAEVLWLAQSGTENTDPDKLLETWLSQRYPLVTEQYPSHITIKGFLLNPTDFPPLPGTLPVQASFAGGARVTGVWLDAQALPARDMWLHPPSNWLHITLYATLAEYELTLEDEAGNVWGGALPRSGVSVQAGPDEIVRLDYDINLNPETPPGTYKVVLRVRAPDGSVSRTGSGEDYLILSTVRIEE